MVSLVFSLDFCSSFALEKSANKIPPNQSFSLDIARANLGFFKVTGRAAANAPGHVFFLKMATAAIESFSAGHDLNISHIFIFLMF